MRGKKTLPINFSLSVTFPWWSLSLSLSLSLLHTHTHTQTSASHRLLLYQKYFSHLKWLFLTALLRNGGISEVKQTCQEISVLINIRTGRCSSLLKLLLFSKSDSQRVILQGSGELGPKCLWKNGVKWGNYASQYGINKNSDLNHWINYK
jgi:hypothetical protein